MADLNALTAGTPSAIRQHYYSRKIKIYLFFILVLAVSAGFYSVERYFELSEKNAIANQSQQFLDDLEKNRTDEREFLIQTKEKNQEILQKIDRELSEVFPQNEQYTPLTRLLDDFFKKNNRQSNPIIATDLQFAQAYEDADKRFLILPFTLNIESSEENFYKFLAFIESSGTLSDKIRLMDIQSINLNFPTDTENPKAKKRIYFNAKLQAYAQKKAGG